MTTFEQPVRRKIRLAPQLHDAFGKGVRVLLFFLCMLEECALYTFRMDTVSHVVVTFVAQRAYQFRCQRLVKQPQHYRSFRLIAFCQCTILDMPSCTVSDRLDIDYKLSILH